MDLPGPVMDARRMGAASARILLLLLTIAVAGAVEQAVPPDVVFVVPDLERSEERLRNGPFAGIVDLVGSNGIPLILGLLGLSSGLATSRTASAPNVPPGAPVPAPPPDVPAPPP